MICSDSCHRTIRRSVKARTTTLSRPGRYRAPRTIVPAKVTANSVATTTIETRTQRDPRNPISATTITSRLRPAAVESAAATIANGTATRIARTHVHHRGIDAATINAAIVASTQKAPVALRYPNGPSSGPPPIIGPDATKHRPYGHDSGRNDGPVHQTQQAPRDQGGRGTQDQCHLGSRIAARPRGDERRTHVQQQEQHSDAVHDQPRATTRRAHTEAVSRGNCVELNDASTELARRPVAGGIDKSTKNSG